MNKKEYLWYLESGILRNEVVHLVQITHRTSPFGNSGASRPPIPTQSGHPFQSIPATDSGQVGHLA
jgi:hypothetical protein